MPPTVPDKGAANEVPGRLRLHAPLPPAVAGVGLLVSPAAPVVPGCGGVLQSHQMQFDEAGSARSPGGHGLDSGEFRRRRCRLGGVGPAHRTLILFVLLSTAKVLAPCG